MSTFVIAEAGVNHCGRIDLALALVDAAAEAGADAVKFQTFTADDLVAPGTPTVAYQGRATGYLDQHAMIAALQLSHEEHAAVRRHATERQIEFMSTAFDPISADFLVSLGVRRLKVPSGEITNLPFLRALAVHGLPMLLSTGMADLYEVSIAVGTLREVGVRDLCVLHCTSTYPTTDLDVNLAAMATIAGACDVAIGYSDHTPDIFVAPLAVARGAQVIEKHLTLDRNLPGPDHRASLLPAEFRTMAANIRRAEAVVGDGIKAVRPSELEARRLVRRGIKTQHALPAGHVLRPDDLVVLRPAEGLPPADLDRVVGRRLARPLDARAPLGWDDFAAE